VKRLYVDRFKVEEMLRFLSFSEGPRWVLCTDVDGLLRCDAFSMERVEKTWNTGGFTFALTFFPDTEGAR
jgi:hypothetical protein